MEDTLNSQEEIQEELADAEAVPKSVEKDLGSMAGQLRHRTPLEVKNFVTLLLHLGRQGSHSPRQEQARILLAEKVLPHLRHKVLLMRSETTSPFTAVAALRVVRFYATSFAHSVLPKDDQRNVVCVFLETCLVMRKELQARGGEIPLPSTEQIGLALLETGNFLTIKEHALIELIPNVVRKICIRIGRPPIAWNDLAVFNKNSEEMTLLAARALTEAETAPIGEMLLVLLAKLKRQYALKTYIQERAAKRKRKTHELH